MIMIDRTRPPETPELPTFRLPHVEELSLANGLSVVLVEDHRFPVASVRLGIDAGSKYEPAELSGLADTTAEVMPEGTLTRTAREIADAVTGIGGSIRADASPDSMLVAGNALSENLDALLELLADVVRNAAFPEEEVELRKQNRKQELLAQLSDASYLADERTNQLVFDGHPYARQEPTIDSIERLNRAAVAAFRDRCLTPNKATLVLAGDFPVQAVNLLEKHFGGWQAIEPPAAPAADFPAPRREIVLIDRAGSVQADIRIARVCVTRTHPDYFPLVVGNTVLGGGASSRLFMNVREEKGYAYDARSVVQSMRDGGMFTALTQVRNEVLKDALGLVLEEMHRIGTEPVSDSELATVKNYLCGTFVLRLETLESLAAQISATKMLGLPLDYLEQYTARVRAVRPEQIRAAAEKYINPDPAAIVVVGDAEALAPQLESFGEIRIEKAPE